MAVLVAASPQGRVSMVQAPVSPKVSKSPSPPRSISRYALPARERLPLVMAMVSRQISSESPTERAEGSEAQIASANRERGVSIASWAVGSAMVAAPQHQRAQLALVGAAGTFAGHLALEHDV